jgi:hypothetical protein
MTVNDSKNNAPPSQFRRNTPPLNCAVHSLIPTVKASDSERGGRGDLLQFVRDNENAHFKTIEKQNLPTVTASDVKRASPNEIVEFESGTGRTTVERLRVAVASESKMQGPLNPEWVELFMGWPKFWTSTTEKVSLETLSRWLELDHWAEGWQQGLSPIRKAEPDTAPRLKCLGNGQVPICAAIAWKILVDGFKQ